MSKKKKDNSILLRYVKALALMFIVGCALVALVLYGLKIYTKHGESVDVPSVRGMQISEAVAVLKQANLKCEVVDSLFLSGGVPGSVIEQVPEENSKIKKDRIIFLTIQAKTVQFVNVPDLRDLSRRQATATLESLGFPNITINEVASVYKGLVIDATCGGRSIQANEKLPKGSSITLTVGAGGEVLIDSIVDYYIEDAESSSDTKKEDPLINNSFFE